MNTKSNLIGYVAAQDSSNSEVTGGIDAFAIGVASVNPDAKINVIITNSWYDPEKKKLLPDSCWTWAVMSWHSTAIQLIRRRWHRNAVFTVSAIIQI